MSQFEIRALSSETWSAFVDLCDRHNGAGFGCWCTWFHWETHSAPGTSGVPRTADETRDFKRRLVETGRAHAALVFDGEAAVGWAQYGSPDELPGISHRKEVQAAGSSLPDWRITCIFVDRRYRHRGIARTALDGALELIAQAGEGPSRAIPKTPRARRCQRRSCITRPAARSSKPASPTTAPKAKITASCAQPSPATGWARPNLKQRQQSDHPPAEVVHGPPCATELLLGYERGPTVPTTIQLTVVIAATAGPTIFIGRSIQPLPADANAVKGLAVLRALQKRLEATAPIPDRAHSPARSLLAHRCHQIPCSARCDWTAETTSSCVGAHCSAVQGDGKG